MLQKQYEEKLRPSRHEFITAMKSAHQEKEGSSLFNHLLGSKAEWEISIKHKEKRSSRAEEISRFK